MNASPSRHLLYVFTGKIREDSIGLDLVVRQQIQALTEGGHRLTLLSRGRFTHPLVTNITLPVTPANLISFLPSRYYYSAQQRFFSRFGSWLVPTARWDGIIGWSRQSLPVFRAGRSRGIPCILNCPDWHYRFNSGDYPWQDHPWPGIHHTMLDAEYHLANHIFTASDFASQSFRAFGIGDDKLHAIGRGADIARFTSQPRPPQPFRVVMFGRLSERKGIGLLLEAWRRAALENAELWLIGGIPSEDEGAIRACLPENARLFGHRNDAETLLSQCHVQVLLTRKEGLAKSLLEGAACGLVTITTPESGFPVQEGENGFLVSRDDLDQVVARLQALAGDFPRWQRLSEQSAAYVRTHFTWEGFRNRFLTTVEACLDSPGIP